MPRYDVVDVYCFALSTGLVAYWPVMARPGRQRFSRRAFVNEMDAVGYGLMLAERYEQIYQGEKSHSNDG
jgi:hypothetical protein